MSARSVQLVLWATLTLVSTGCDAGLPESLCGNGVQDDGEQCDDGNLCNGDGCTERCTTETSGCGDGLRQMGESCDDGNAVSGDGCASTCVEETCGDGVIQAPEECDDGNDVDCDDACNNACVRPALGDGVVQAGEECDLGMPSDEGPCRDGTRQRCGDGVLYEGVEDCDDGNTEDGDACPGTCQLAPCGDGVVDVDEECDDGNREDGDDCTNACRLPRCGDLIVWTGVEECDGGPDCTADCNPYRCGDGLVQCGEVCDDGDGAACDATCRTYRCEEETWPGFDVVTTHMRWPWSRPSCVVSSATPRSWPAAATACAELGGALASPLDSVAAQEHARTMGVADVWIGVDDREREGRFRTLGGPQWAHGQPDDGGPSGEQDCVAVAAEGRIPSEVLCFRGQGTWTDEVCDSERAFTCVVPLTP